MQENRRAVLARFLGPACSLGQPVAKRPGQTGHDVEPGGIGKPVQKGKLLLQIRRVQGLVLPGKGKEVIADDGSCSPETQREIRCVCSVSHLFPFPGGNRRYRTIGNIRRAL